MQEMKVLGVHKQPFNLIRSNAIICHALDLSSHRLFLNSTYNNKKNEVKELYDVLLSTHLLQLAVAIRINIYQGLTCDGISSYVMHCGFLDITKDGKEETKEFSIKDVCDKIIHAKKIERKIGDCDKNNGSSSVMMLQGTHYGKQWNCSLSVNLFCEAVLNWLDDIEDL